MGSIICRLDMNCSFLSFISSSFLFLLSLPASILCKCAGPCRSPDQPSNIAGESLLTMLADDGSYLFRSLYRDGVDLIKLPLRVT